MIIVGVISVVSNTGLGGRQNKFIAKLMFYTGIKKNLADFFDHKWQGPGRI